PQQPWPRARRTEAWAGRREARKGLRATAHDSRQTHVSAPLFLSNGRPVAPLPGIALATARQAPRRRRIVRGNGRLGSRPLANAARKLHLPLGRHKRVGPGPIGRRCGDLSQAFVATYMMCMKPGSENDALAE